MLSFNPQKQSGTGTGTGKGTGYFHFMSIGDRKLLAKMNQCRYDDAIHF